MEKKCGICKEIKNICEFNKNKWKVDGYQTICRTCSKDKSKKYYIANRVEQRKKIGRQNKERKNNSRLEIIKYLSNHPCVDCGNNNIIVLDFDHRDTEIKSHNICDMVAGGYVWRSIEKEIEKCDVRCANCHRVKTAYQFGNYKISV